MRNLRYWLNIKGIRRIGSKVSPPRVRCRWVSPSRVRRRRGQATIELTLGLIALFLLLCGIFRVFVWFNQSLVERQEAYSRTRPTMSIDYYTPRELKVF